MEQLTKQDILELFKESDRRFSMWLREGLEESRRAFDERLAKEALERKKSRREFDERLAKEALEREESRIKIEQDLARSRMRLEQELADSRREFDRRLEKSRKEFERDLKKSRKEFNKKIGELTGTWGRFVEELVKPKSVELFRNRGIEVTTIFPGVIGKKDNEDFYQIDLFLINDTQAIAVEVKSTLKVVDVDEHLERLEKIRKYPPKRFDLKGVKLLGAVAAIIIDGDADKYAYKKGLFVLRQKGNIVEIVNDRKFKPKEWLIER